jgi:L-alanine-DL-glutamate epimerase-like enolase superfamily enzyme
MEAPLGHAAGAHWGRFVHTIVETEDGLVDLGGMGGVGESAEAAVLGIKQYLIGHNPFDLEAVRFKISNPAAEQYRIEDGYPYDRDPRTPDMVRRFTQSQQAANTAALARPDCIAAGQRLAG